MKEEIRDLLLSPDDESFQLGVTILENEGFDQTKIIKYCNNIFDYHRLHWYHVTVLLINSKYEIVRIKYINR